ncbi:MAG TPA: MFS transporter [Gammaproteobacteria bacterium]|nr:MFS transporter [Gammaproteobacteria bacterium]
MRTQPVFKNPRILAVALLGFSSGLPLALTGSTLQAWFTQAGISLMAIGALSLIGIPYALKFVWAPIMDKVIPPFWGRRRGWIAITQMGLCAALFFLANLDPRLHAVTMGQVALFIAFFSASQDIAIDAYRTDTLLPSERGYGSAFFIFTARVSVIISGGLALILADRIGWKMTYQFMAVLMLLSASVTWFAPDIPDSIKPPNSFKAAIVEPFKDLFRREAIFLILPFIILYKFGDALALQLMSTFLLRGLDFTLTDVGIAYKTIGFAASIMGALAGGALLGRLGLFRSLLFFGIAQAFTNLLFMLLAIVGKNYSMMITSMFLENFFTGMSTTALLVFVTALCNQKYSATQFACLSALFSIGRIFLGPLAAVMVARLGWAYFYGWTFVICFPALLLLGLMRSRVTFNAEAIA